MAEKKEFTVGGKVQSNEKVDFLQENLSIHAMVESKSIASTKVLTDGGFKLKIPKENIGDAIELKVVPESLSELAGSLVSVGKTISVQTNKKDVIDIRDLLEVNIHLPKDILEMFRVIKKTYKMHGTVFGTRFEHVNGVSVPVFVTPLPAVKIEFYEVDNYPLANSQYIGQTFTAPDGSYEFTFTFSYRTGRFPWPLPFLTDKVPDIRAKMHQFFNGAWVLVHEDKVDWNIAQNTLRSYFIPEDKLMNPPIVSVKPAVGFRFVSLGLLPIDDTRFIKGYVTSQTADPISVRHQPLCGVLRIFGLFATNRPVVKYAAQYTEANENGPVGTWKNIADPVYNSKWNTTSHSWEVKVLGPDPVTGYFTNIDTEPEIDWHEHALKITWNSGNVRNGYYAIRVIGYDAAGAEVDTCQMPVVKIDNIAPEVSVEAIGTTLGGVTECGYLRIPVSPPGRSIKFRVKAYDTEGHVLQYTLSGSRGKSGEKAGAAIMGTRPNVNQAWTGELAKEVDFIVDSLSPTSPHCPAIAYSFLLEVWGSATNGYHLGQYVRQQTNLVIAEVIN